MKTTRCWWRLWSVVVLAFILGAGQTCATVSPKRDRGKAFDIKAYGIRAYDNLLISSTMTTLNVGQMSVADDGTITMPYVGKIKISGLTKSEAEQVLYDTYVPKYYTDVRINIEITSLIYYIYGEVKIPGQKGWIKDTTLIQAIISAGGFTDFANRRAVVVTRTVTTENGNEATQNFKYNCAKIEAGKVIDPQISPNDKIRVPRKLF